MAYVGIPAFVVTLAGMMLFRGANQFLGKSNTIPGAAGDPVSRRGVSPHPRGGTWGLNDPHP